MHHKVEEYYVQNGSFANILVFYNYGDMLLPLLRYVLSRYKNPHSRTSEFQIYYKTKKRFLRKNLYSIKLTGDLGNNEHIATLNSIRKEIEYVLDVKIKRIDGLVNAIKVYNY